MKSIKVLIVDDRDIIRDSLKMVFLNSKDINVVGEASDGKEAVELIEKKDFDVVLMDVSMPKMNGVEATKKIRQLKPQTKILASSFNASATFIKDMIRAGASGFIKKGEDSRNYIDAIKTMVKGDIYLSDEIDHKVYAKAAAYLKY